MDTSSDSKYPFSFVLYVLLLMQWQTRRVISGEAATSAMGRCQDLVADATGVLQHTAKALASETCEKTFELGRWLLKTSSSDISACIRSPSALDLARFSRLDLLIVALVFAPNTKLVTSVRDGTDDRRKLLQWFDSQWNSAPSSHFLPASVLLEPAAHAAAAEHVANELSDRIDHQSVHISDSLRWLSSRWKAAHDAT